jgi:hypothetical protein
MAYLGVLFSLIFGASNVLYALVFGKGFAVIDPAFSGKEVTE